MAGNNACLPDGFLWCHVDSVAVGMRAEGAQDGLTAILTTDRDSYDAGDTVAAELTVVNENSYAVGNVRTEISLRTG